MISDKITFDLSLALEASKDDKNTSLNLHLKIFNKNYN